MQLNNKTNGHIILIDKIDINQNRIVYTEYQYYSKDLQFIKEQKSYQFKDIILKDYLNQSINYTELCYTNLKSELNLTDFITESDTQNWLFTDRPQRIIVLSSFILKELQPINTNGDLSDIGNVINNERTANYGFYKDNPDDEISILYINQVDSGDATVITPFVGTKMFIETKNQ